MYIPTINILSEILYIPYWKIFEIGLRGRKFQQNHAHRALPEPLTSSSCWQLTLGVKGLVPIRGAAIPHQEEQTSATNCNCIFFWIIYCSILMFFILQSEQLLILVCAVCLTGDYCLIWNVIRNSTWNVIIYCIRS